MRTIIVLLSVALIYVGIAAVMYVDAKSSQGNRGVNQIGYVEQGDAFAKRQTMKEIDSVTAVINYPFTEKNKIIHLPADSIKILPPDKNS